MEMLLRLKAIMGFLGQIVALKRNATICPRGPWDKLLHQIAISQMEMLLRLKAIMGLGMVRMAPTSYTPT